MNKHTQYYYYLPQQAHHRKKKVPEVSSQQLIMWLNVYHPRLPVNAPDNICACS